ncbi:MAG: carboxymuconolactone decarboxylase family protein [Actinomycetota bacterium]
MPRTREVPRDEAHPFAQRLYGVLFGDRDPVVEPGTETGTPGNWWSVTAAVPDMFDHIVAGFSFYRAENRVLDPQLRELGQTRTGYARASQFVYSQHCKASRWAGLSEEKIEAVRNWSVADCYSPAERAVLAYTDCLVLEGGRVPDGVFEALREHLSEEAILELTYVVCTYDMHATMSKALRLEYDDVDDRIVEIPAPEGDGSGDASTAQSTDAMAVVDDAE